jgi:hypothetical protein
MFENLTQSTESVNAWSSQDQRDARELHRREMAEKAIEKLTGQEKETATRLEADRRARYDSGLEYSTPEPDAFSTPSRSLPTPNIQNTGSTTLHSITDLLVSVGSRANEKITQLSSPLAGYVYDARNINASPGDNTQDNDRWSHVATPSTAGSNLTPDTSMGRSSINETLTPQTGSYSCTHPGCTAPPFQAQYLLNSHMNVHSTPRPYFCPVKICHRAEGGRGFKSKSELIRHGLVHDSSSYTCPFCPGRKRKFIRPHFLQR